MEFSFCEWRRYVLAACALFLFSCGGGGESDDDADQQQPDPPASLDSTPTETIVANTADTAGSSVDSALNAASQVSGSSRILDSVQPNFANLWNAEATRLISTSLALNDSDGTTRDGNRITIDPDEATLCTEDALDVDNNQIDRERCQTLLQDLRVQIDPTDATTGSVTYLFQNQPVLVVGYSETSSSMEIRLAGVKTLIDAEVALNPDENRGGPYTSFEGTIRQTSTTTNSTPGAEAGSNTLEVTEAVSIVSEDGSQRLSIAPGRLFDMSVDAATETGRITLDIGAVDAGGRAGESEVDYDLDGLTAEIDISANAEQLEVDNVSVGDGPLRVAVDETEVLALEMETFGFTSRESDGELILDGALDSSILVSSALPESKALRTLRALFGPSISYDLSAPAGTRTVRQSDGNALLVAGGPIVSSQVGQDPIEFEVGDCFSYGGGYESSGFGLGLNYEVTDSLSISANYGFEEQPCATSDSDGDGILDINDNCPGTSNADQADQDSDGFGDACDADLDGDGQNNGLDNCPDISNADQTDTDGDGIGDACDNSNDSDTDSDGVPDVNDNCPADSNADQANQDGDGLGDVCDDDRDGDSVNNDVDNCPVNSNSDQADADNDGVGDVCDNSDDTDTDNDGVIDSNDNCPAVSNADQANQDGDGLGDVCDDDRDGDGVDNDVDNCPVNSNGNQADTDNDGIGDVCDSNDDTDTDSDGVIDSVDNCPTVSNADQANQDGDGLGDCDNSDDTDTDSDGVIDSNDNCPTVSNADQANQDGDGLGDVCDDDRDGDGVNNDVDNCLRQQR